jgi:hypothetical protein
MGKSRGITCTKENLGVKLGQNITTTVPALATFVAAAWNIGPEA